MNVQVCEFAMIVCLIFVQMGDGGHGMMGSGMHMQNPGGHGQMSGPGPVMSHMPPDSHNHNRGQLCVRNGCNNTAMTSPEWDEEYCSSECVVTHCRQGFNNFRRCVPTYAPYTMPGPCDYT